MEIWREQRTAVNPIFSRKSSALHYVEDLHEISSDCVDRIAETRDDKNEIINAIPDNIRNYVFEAMSKIFLDVRMGALEPGELDPTCAKFIAMARQICPDYWPEVNSGNILILQLIRNLMKHVLMFTK